MKNTRFPKSLSFNHNSRGFTLVELLIGMSAISVVCGLGVVTVKKTQEISAQHKLQSDVANINSAVKVFLASGGTIPANANAETVLNLLKQNTTQAHAKTIVGVSGSLIDIRVEGIEQTAGTKDRAVWNADEKHFTISQAGDGFSSFKLNPSLSAQTFGQHARQTQLRFSEESGWVWDYNSEITPANHQPPAEFGMEPQPVIAYVSPHGTQAVKLQPPTPSVAGGLFSLNSLPSATQLINPNAAGSSLIYYRVNNGGWQRYTPEQWIPLPTSSLDNYLIAYAASTNTEEWQDSANGTSNYKVIYFSGFADGNFRKPAGDSGLVTNLTGNKKGKYFSWGDPAAGQPKPNSLTYTSNTSFSVSPDEEFSLGKIDYYNGTTYSGTNATSVKLELDLNFTTPGGREVLEFTLNLQSTPNNGRSENEDADYVWIPSLASQFTTQIHGQTFYLKLRFGNSSANGFTNVSEFHVHENKTASGTIVGKFTLNP